MDESDEAAMIRYQKGDERAFAILVDRYFRALYSFCYRFVRTSGEAEDLVQETFVKVWRHRARFKPEMKFKTWVYTIARNTTYDYLRKRRDVALSQFDHEEGNVLLDTVADEDPTPLEAALASQSAEAIDAALRALPALYREVLLLRLLEETTFEEMSDILKKPLNTVKSQYRRGLGLLRTELEGRL